MSTQDIKEVVKTKYGEAALRAKTGGSSCCGASAAGDACCDPITSNLYDAAETGSLPEEVVNEDLATSLLLTAKALTYSDPAAMQSAPELELWVKHLRPVWRNDMASMKRALIDCYQEASDLGVLRGTQKVEDILRFLL